MIRMQTVCRIINGKQELYRQWRKDWDAYISGQPHIQAQVCGDFANPETYHVLWEVDNFAGLDAGLKRLLEDSRFMELWTKRRNEFTTTDTTRYVLVLQDPPPGQTAPARPWTRRLQTVFQTVRGKTDIAQQWFKDWGEYIGTQRNLDIRAQVFGDLTNPTMFHVTFDFDGFAGLDGALQWSAEDSRFKELWVTRLGEFTENNSTRYILSQI